MCLALYIGTRKEIPLIPYKEKDKHLWTEKPHKKEELIKRHFSLPVVTYVGSDLGCGCGFRHTFLHNGEWGYGEKDKESDTVQNHKELFVFIKENLSDHDKIEIYTIWEGDEGAAESLPKYKEEINSTELVNKDFYFKEQGFYIVNVLK